jgi:hypothetical protein
MLFGSIREMGKKSIIILSAFVLLTTVFVWAGERGTSDEAQGAACKSDRSL